MSDKVLWHSNRTQSYISGLDDEAKKNALRDRGYDDEMLDNNLDDVIAQDDYMWQDDAEDFQNDIVPMINAQTNGYVLAINAEDPQGDVLIVTADELSGGDICPDAKEAYLVDAGDGLEMQYFDQNNERIMTLQLFAIPEDPEEEKQFINKVMPSAVDADIFGDDFEDDDPYMRPSIDVTDYDTLEDFVDKDRLKQFGKRIVSESLQEDLIESFPEEQPFVEAQNSGIGYENAEKFIKYLKNNDRVDNGPFGEDPIVNKGGAVRLFSQTSDITFNFTDDGGVIVEGDDEELGRLEEYFDTLDDFVKWCQAEALSLGSDVGCYDMERYLYSGEEVEESLNEARQKVNTEELGTELEEIKETLDDFGPREFYDKPYEQFKSEFPEFANGIVEDFLVKYVSIKPEEMSDPEVLEAWQTGELIRDEDWPCLLEGAEKKVNGVGFQWEKIYPKHQKRNESLNEDKKAPLKSLLGMSKDDVVLALKDRFGGSHLIKCSEKGDRVDAGEYGYWDGREPAAYYGGVTCWLNDDNTVEVVETYNKSWSKQNESLDEATDESLAEDSKVEKLKAYYGPKFDKKEEEALEEAKYTKDELVDKFGTDDVDLVNAGREEDVELVNEPLNEAEDYLVVPGDMAVAKDVMASEGK